MEDTGTFKDLGLSSLTECLPRSPMPGWVGPPRYWPNPKPARTLPSWCESAQRIKSPSESWGGTNLLIRSAGVSGVVLRLAQPEFQQIEITGKTVRCGSGADTLDLIKASSRAGLGGLESLVGFAGTVGRAVITNAGTHETASANWFAV